jgi:hypothetical protein
MTERAFAHQALFAALRLPRAAFTLPPAFFPKPAQEPS